MTVRINMVCCTWVIKNEIRQGMRQKDIALSYVMAMRSEADGDDNPDWKAINEAIIAKWGRRGLTRVKNRVRAIIEGRIEP